MSYVIPAGGGVYDHAIDSPTYTLEVSRETNAQGYYTGHVAVNGNYVSGTAEADLDRDALIEKLRSFAAWHRTHDPSTETIPL